MSWSGWPATYSMLVLNEPIRWPNFWASWARSRACHWARRLKVPTSMDAVVPAWLAKTWGLGSIRRHP